jgi:glutamine amidotransferase PdxT
VRTPADLEDLDSLVIPGGESTTIGKGIASAGLEPALRFETDLEVEGIGDEPLRAVFIRAPWVESHGAGVEVLASYEGHPVAIREGSVLACAFHPELTDDPRFHAIFMAMTSAARERSGEEAAR